MKVKRIVRVVILAGLFLLHPSKPKPTPDSLYVPQCEDVDWFTWWMAGCYWTP